MACEIDGICCSIFASARPSDDSDGSMEPISADIWGVDENVEVVDAELSCKFKKMRVAQGRKGHRCLACNANSRKELWCNLQLGLDLALAYIVRLAAVETTRAVIEKLVVRSDSTVRTESSCCYS